MFFSLFSITNQNAEKTFKIVSQEGSNVSCLMEESKKRNMTFREFTPEGGETIQHVQARVESFFKVNVLTVIKVNIF